MEHKEKKRKYYDMGKYDRTAVWETTFDPAKPFLPTVQPPSSDLLGQMEKTKTELYKAFDLDLPKWDSWQKEIMERISSGKYFSEPARSYIEEYPELKKIERPKAVLALPEPPAITAAEANAFLATLPED